MNKSAKSERVYSPRRYVYTPFYLPEAELRPENGLRSSSHNSCFEFNSFNKSVTFFLSSELFASATFSVSSFFEGDFLHGHILVH